ncbi:helicase-related protein [Streptococcus sp. 2A/TPW/M5]
MAGKNFGKTNYGRSVEYKHAIVDYFKEHSKILIVTDAGSEGLNLQFCNTVINYDLLGTRRKLSKELVVAIVMGKNMMLLLSTC